MLLQGAFDILNYGHIRAFKFAKAQGDYLIVALNTNELIRGYKGREPVMPWSHKRSMIEACRYVDKVVPAREFSPLKLLKRYQVDVYVLSYEWEHTKAAEIAYMKQKGGRVCFSRRFRGVSTSAIKATLLKEHFDAQSTMVQPAAVSGRGNERICNDALFDGAIASGAPLYLNGAGNLGRLAREFLAAVGHEPAGMFERGDPIPEEGARVAVSVVTSPYVAIERSLAARGCVDVVPFYDLAESCGAGIRWRMAGLPTHSRRPINGRSKACSRVGTITCRGPTTCSSLPGAGCAKNGHLRAPRSRPSATSSRKSRRGCATARPSSTAVLTMAPYRSRSQR